MKFRVGDIVRHVNGVKEFVVFTTDRIQCVYGLKEEGSPVVHYYAACHVDRMYRQPSWNEPSESDFSVKQNTIEKIVRLATGYEGMPGAGYKPDTGCGAEPVSPPVGPSSDVSVRLPGLPAEYYLKSFRKAELGELILNTSGVVLPAKITQNGMTLYRPIVGRVSDLKRLNAPSLVIPGVPLGWEVIAYRVPVEGEKYLSTVGGCEGVVTADRAVNFKRLVVKPILRLTPCDGTLPGIPKGYRLVGFGAVNEKQFYIDTVGTLKPGPARHRLILEPLKDGPVNQPEVVTEYEVYCQGGTTWAAHRRLAFASGTGTWYTGGTRKVVLQ